MPTTRGMEASIKVLENKESFSTLLDQLMQKIVSP